MTTARELHNSYAEKGVMLWMGDPSAQQIILRALDLLARVEESKDELVRELRECQNSAHIRWELFDKAAAALVALKAERDKIKAHAEAIHKSANSYLNEEEGDTWEVLQHHLDTYRRDFPKDAP